MKKITLLIILVFSLAILFSCDIIEMPYEEIEGGYNVEKFSSFSEFSSSTTYSKLSASIKNTYGEIFFNTKNLILVKYNYEKSDVGFLLKEVIYNDSTCSIKVLPHINSKIAEVKNSTYYCYVETTKEISNLTVSFEVLTAVNSDAVISGFNTKSVGEDHNVYSYMDIYVIKNLAGLTDIATEKPSYINAAEFNEQFFLLNDLFIIDMPLTLEGSAIQIINNNIVIYNVDSMTQTEMLGQNNQYSFGVYALAIPKDTVIGNIGFTYYFSYNNDTDTVRDEDKTETKTFTTETITENLVKLNIVES